MIFLKECIFVVAFCLMFGVNAFNNAGNDTIDPNLLNNGTNEISTTTIPKVATNLASTISTISTTTLSEIEKCNGKYDCLLEIKNNLNTSNQTEWTNDEFILYDNLPNFTHIYYTPGASSNGIITMCVICALIVIIGNGAAFGYFFWWNFQPLSRRPTDDEMDAQLDQDLPVILVNHEKRAGGFQFAADVPKDTQTIMAACEVPQQSDNNLQPSSMPSELKSAVADVAPPQAGTPRRIIGGGRGGRGGGRRGAVATSARGRGRK